VTLHARITIGTALKPLFDQKSGIQLGKVFDSGNFSLLFIIKQCAFHLCGETANENEQCNIEI